MAKLDQLLTLERMLEAYDGLGDQEAMVVKCQEMFINEMVDSINAKLDRLLKSKVRLSCRNVLAANFETMTRPDHWLKHRFFDDLSAADSKVQKAKLFKMVNLMKALMVKIIDVDPDYAETFLKRLKDRCDELRTSDYDLWKASLPELTMDVLTEYQVELTANMLIMGILKYDRKPSGEEMDGVMLEKLLKKLRHGKELPPNFKEECAKLRRYSYWEGEFFFIKFQLLLKYIYRNLGKFSETQRIALFDYNVQMKQVHQDMKWLLEETKGRVQKGFMMASDKAKIYMQRLNELGFVDENGKLKPETTRQQAMYIAEPFAEKLGLKNKWKRFEDYWGIKNLAQEKWTFQQTGLMPARYQEIDKVFAD